MGRADGGAKRSEAIALAIALFTLVIPLRASLALSVPNHYPHIRTYAGFYANPKDPRFTPANRQWLADHIDVAVVSPIMNQRAVGTQLVYVNWQDLREGDAAYRDLVTSAIAGKVDPESLFFHFGKDVAVPLQSSQGAPSAPLKSLREERFLSILTYRAVGDSFSDSTADASGDVSATQSARTYDVSGPSNPHDALYIGSAERFQAIRFTIQQPAPTAWQGRLEYWNGHDWTELSLSNEEIQGFTRSGLIHFEPPSSWNRKDVNHLALYWVRLVCLSSGASPPVFPIDSLLLGSSYPKGGASHQ